MAKHVISLFPFPPPIVQEEDKAAEAITPGHLIGYDSNGDWVKHATAGVAAPRVFALERSEMGKGIDDAYAVDDVVKAGVFSPGQRVYAFLASGENVVKGDRLTSHGDGMLQKHAGSEITLASALEDVDASGAAGNSRIRVEIV